MTRVQIAVLLCATFFNIRGEENIIAHEPECGALEFVASEYGLSLHIIASFLVTGISLLGSGIPLFK
jgi:hypothetical protein